MTSTINFNNHVSCYFTQSETEVILNLLEEKNRRINESNRKCPDKMIANPYGKILRKIGYNNILPEEGQVKIKGLTSTTKSKRELKYISY